MELSLVLIAADGTQRELPVKKPRSVIGRNPDCTIRIPVSEVSRQHCEIASDDTRAVVRDLGSSNGTFVNRAAVAEHRLAAGDVIVVGPATFVVKIDGHPAHVDAAQVLASSKAPAKLPADAPRAIPAVSKAAGSKPAAQTSNLASKPASKPAAKTPAKDASGSSFGLPPLTGDPGDSSVADFDFTDDDEKDMPKL